MNSFFENGSDASDWARSRDGGGASEQRAQTAPLVDSSAQIRDFRLINALPAWDRIGAFVRNAVVEVTSVSGRAGRARRDHQPQVAHGLSSGAWCDAIVRLARWPRLGLRDLPITVPGVRNRGAQGRAVAPDAPWVILKLDLLGRFVQFGEDDRPHGGELPDPGEQVGQLHKCFTALDAHDTVVAHPGRGGGECSQERFQARGAGKDAFPDRVSDTVLQVRGHKARIGDVDAVCGL